MSNIPKINFYIEKYNNYTGELLLDFIFESEFIYFRIRGDYVESMYLSQFEPTMLLVKNITKKIEFKKGQVVSIVTEKLKKSWYNQRIEEVKNHTVVAFTIKEGDLFLEDIKQEMIIYRDIPEKFKNTIIETWDGNPWGLNNLQCEFKVNVWDVAQGSTNSISDSRNLTFFDFGASLEWTKQTCEDVLNKHRELINNSERISIIISHWDSDHYNLLTVVDDNFLKKVCCVFVPEKVVSLTAKNILNHILKKCNYVRTVKSPKKTKKRWIGVQPAQIEGNYYKIYIGEESKQTNLSGMLLVLFNNGKILMLTADHSNRQVWEGVYSDISRVTQINEVNLIVPHHGGNCGNLNITKGINAELAIISVGKNSYKHPVQKVVDKYKENGFNILRTDWEREDIEIEMK